MDLKNFVSETLQQIMSGVAEAQLQSEQGEVNPDISRAVSKEWAKSRTGRRVHNVNFDVAVTVGQSSETKGGIGLVVGPVLLGSKGQSNAENSSVSRIKFEVPITYPVKQAEE